jgi:two-component system nitrogen regulation response regulator NtrX
VALHAARPDRCHVLLEGESGTGKELFARALHALSDRADARSSPSTARPFPETLLETELFGTRRGVYGRVGAQAGKFELRHRGTLFLDEIGDLPLSLQAKILRALETKRFERVGGYRPLHVDRARRRGDEPEPEGGAWRSAQYRGRSCTSPVGVSDPRFPRCASVRDDYHLLAKYF